MPAEISVTLTTDTNDVWRIIELYPPVGEGWSGTYMYQYTGTTPGEAYHKGTFSGRLERVSAPKGTGNGGETNATFTADTEGTSTDLEYRIQPPDEQTVCAGNSATFYAEKLLEGAADWVPADSFWTIGGDTNYPEASSVVIPNTTTGIYAVVAQNSPTRALSETATLTVLRVDIQQTNVYYFAMTTNVVNFNLTNSYLGNGTVHWTGGPTNEFLGSGDPLTFTVPTNWPAGEHTITAYSDLLTNCLDTAKLTILKAEFIDEFPSYSLDSNTDSDNHFFRKNDDHKDLDIYYRNLPAGVPLDDVKIKVYNGNTMTVLVPIPGETDTTGAFKTGDDLHVTWTAPENLGTADPGFYRLQLQVFAGGSSTPICETSIDDANPSEPGWQCPDDCLAIHDMVYKHRPVLKMASGEISEPVSVTFPMSRSKIFEWKYNVWLSSWLPDVRASNPVSLSDMSTYDASQFWFGFVDANDRFNPPSWPMRIYHLDFVSGDYAFLQYWMYFATSYLPVGGVPDVWWHEGDWEMYQFSVKLKDAANPSDKSKWYEPFAVTCSQHYYGQTLKWKAETGDNAPSSQDQDYVEKSGEQPVLYVAIKSHALHLRSGKFKTVTGTPVGSQHQYQVPTSTDIPTDITGSAATRLPDSSHLIYIKKDPIINEWNGKWGAVNQPASIPVFGNGPSSPKYRGPSEVGGSLTIQSDPKGFHNSYMKTGQSISIP